MNEELKYRTTYVAQPTDPFWACAVRGCHLDFPHMVGITHDLKWKHVYADFYAAAPHLRAGQPSASS